MLKWRGCCWRSLIFSSQVFVGKVRLLKYFRQRSFLFVGLMCTASFVWSGGLISGRGVTFLLPDNLNRLSAIPVGFHHFSGYFICSFNAVLTTCFSTSYSSVFVCYLRIVGLGYKLLPKRFTVELKVGFSVNNRFVIPELLREFRVLDKRSQTLCVLGQFNSKTVAWVRSMQFDRGVDLYKGKGLHYIDTYPDWCYPYFKRKVGKKSEW